MAKAFRCFIADESGATAVEYGLIAALVSLFAGAIVASMGDTVLAMWTTIRDGVLEAAGLSPA
jgi:pilus assembly protein Flp/PilA